MVRQKDPEQQPAWLGVDAFCDICQVAYVTEEGDEPYIILLDRHVRPPVVKMSVACPGCGKSLTFGVPLRDAERPATPSE